MLHYFSMSWNAMFLVLLTLYSVIHFIINSLPNTIASVLIEVQEQIIVIDFRHQCKQANSTIIKRINRLALSKG